MVPSRSCTAATCWQCWCIANRHSDEWIASHQQSVSAEQTCNQPSIFCFLSKKRQACQARFTHHRTQQWPKLLKYVLNPIAWASRHLDRGLCLNLITTEVLSRLSQRWSHGCSSCEYTWASRSNGVFISSCDHLCARMTHSTWDQWLDMYTSCCTHVWWVVVSDNYQPLTKRDALQKKSQSWLHHATNLCANACAIISICCFHAQQGTVSKHTGHGHLCQAHITCLRCMQWEKPQLSRSLLHNCALCGPLCLCAVLRTLLAILYPDQ